MAVAVLISVASTARAEESIIDFDGGSMRTVNFINAVKDNDAGPQPALVPSPTPSVDTLFSYNTIGEMGKITQAQPAIKAFVTSYNQHVLHDTKVGADLQLEGVGITLKLPGQVLVTKNGEVLDTIDNVIMVNTIRHNLGGSATVTRGKCLIFVAETIAVWVIDHFIDKVVQVCSEWEPEPKPVVTPTPNNTQDQHPEQPIHHQHQY